MNLKNIVNRAVDRLCGLAARLVLRVVEITTVTRYVRVLVSKPARLRVSRATASPEAAPAAGQLALPF